MAATPHRMTAYLFGPQAPIGTAREHERAPVDRAEPGRHTTIGQATPAARYCYSANRDSAALLGYCGMAVDVKYGRRLLTVASHPSPVANRWFRSSGIAGFPRAAS